MEEFDCLRGKACPAKDDKGVSYMRKQGIPIMPTCWICKPAFVVESSVVDAGTLKSCC